MVIRSLVIIVLMFASVDPAVGQATAVVTGHVLDEHGQPLVGAQVLIEGSNRGAVTDSVGAFRIADLASGDVTVLAQIIAHEQGRRRLRLSAGESVQIVLELAQVEIEIAGAGVPLPDPSLLAAAETLLPSVLQDSAARRLLSAIGTRPAIVWVPWASNALKTPEGATYELRVVCTECTAGRSSTVEGGAQYTAGIAHVRVGVMRSRGRPGLTFCIDSAPADEVLMDNCFGPGGTVLIQFSQTESGLWRREG